MACPLDSLPGRSGRQGRALCSACEDAILETEGADDTVTYPPETPRSSVVVCTKDRATTVKKTVAGLRDQAGASPFEIVVVDDGSEPAVVLDDFVGEPAVRVSRIAHQGRSAARNHGSALARGFILIFVDDDIRVGPDFVAAHERAHRRWDHALVVGSVVPGDPSLQGPVGRFRRRLETKGLPTAHGIAERPNFCTAANMSISRRAFAELGGFNPQLHSAEDQDLALRHSNRGRPIVFAPEAAAVHDDLALDIRGYCAKVEWTGRHLVDFCRAQPDWPENVQRLRVNGPLLLGREPTALTAKKLGKALLGRPLVLEAFIRLTSLVERTLGEGPLLDALYRALLGVHLQKGFRRGFEACSREGAGGGGAS